MTKVMACIDDTDVSPAVCDYAAWASLRMSAPLEFLHVLEKTGVDTTHDLSGNLGLGARTALLEELASLDEQRRKLARKHSQHLLDEARKRAEEFGVANPTTLQRHGTLVDAVKELEPEIRLLVMGKHDQHLHEHIGSRLESVVRVMTKPILISTKTFKAPEKIMIAFDGSDTTRKAVEMVAEGALFRGLPCHLVMIGEVNKSNQDQLDWASATLQSAGYIVTASLIKGDVERGLCDYRLAHDLDLLVMGAYGRSAIRRFLVGSTTTCVIRNAAVPVVLVR